MRLRSSRLLHLGALAALVSAGHVHEVQSAAAPAMRVLFVGNSYTSVNDLPRMFAALAASGGRNVVTMMQAPGGELLQGHANDPHALAMLDQRGWDFVVLQEQSQVPAIEPARSQVMFPAARVLVARA